MYGVSLVYAPSEGEVNTRIIEAAAIGRGDSAEYEAAIMKQHAGRLDRRDFLRRGAGVAAAIPAMAAASESKVAAGEKTISLSESGMPVRPFGKTGHSFPVLGHGGSAMMAKEYGYYHLEEPPPMDARIAMVRDAYEKGVRYFDTARIYQESERILGKALGDVRDNVYLASKVLVDSVEKIRPSVEESLRQLGMDRIDCMQIHGPTIERAGYDGAMKQYEELVKLRDEGLFRFIGISGHGAFNEMYKLIAGGAFDQVLIEYGYFRKGYSVRHSESSIEWRENCVAKAHEIGIGIVAMKVLGAWVFNHNAPNMVEGYDPEAVKRLPGAAIRWVLNDPRICVLNIDVSYPGDADKNIATLKGNLTLTNEDRLLLADFSARAYEHPSIQELPVV